MQTEFPQRSGDIMKDALLNALDRNELEKALIGRGVSYEDAQLIISDFSKRLEYLYATLLNENKSNLLSDTNRVAEWKKDDRFSHWSCTNCGHTKNHGYPAHAIILSKFCPECGFKMLNPKVIHVEYDDYY